MLLTPMTGTTLSFSCSHAVKSTACLCREVKQNAKYKCFQRLHVSFWATCWPGQYTHHSVDLSWVSPCGTTQHLLMYAVSLPSQQAQLCSHAGHLNKQMTASHMCCCGAAYIGLFIGRLIQYLLHPRAATAPSHALLWLRTTGP